MKRFEFALCVACLGVAIPSPASARPQATELVSVDAGGAPANGVSQFPCITPDARYVAFGSAASDLVPVDANGFQDVFVRDRSSGQTWLVSVDSSAVQGDGPSFSAAISDDARFVAFDSTASNLVAGDTNGRADVFIHDRSNGQTTRVSVDSSGVEADDASFDASISADGRYVAFWSIATNLVAGDTNDRADVFVHDRATAQTMRVSVDSSGAQASGFSGEPSISSDGRYVAFASDASDLVSGDLNGHTDVFRHDVQTGQTTRVSVSSSGGEGDSSSFSATISGDGRYVAFASNATNLVAGDANGTHDIFLHDVQTGQTTRVSVDSAGAEADDGSEHPAISSDGRYVAYFSFATSLVPGDTNDDRDVFVHDRSTGRSARVSVDSTGAQANDHSIYPAISTAGPQVAFYSDATNLSAGDTNGVGDVFVHGPVSFGAFAAFCFGDGSLATPCPCVPPNTVPSPSGAPGYGCANSFDLSGGLLSAAGSTSPDTITFAGRIGPGYVGFGFLVKGSARSAMGFANGDGVRCVDGALIRFGGHNAGTNGAAVGFWSYPNTVQTTPVSIATAQGAGQTAWYQLFYRNAAASFCSTGTTNWTNGVEVAWP